MTCAPIRFGTTNDVPEMTLTSTVTPDTSLEWLKNEFKARQVRWTDLSSADIVVEGTLAETRVLEYFAMPSANLTSASQVKLEVFDDAGTKVDILGRDFQDLATPIPAGEFRVGIDQWGVPDDSTIPGVVLIWLDVPTPYRGFRLTIKHGLTDGQDEVLLRMLMMGEKLQLQHNFGYGGDIAFQVSPELIQTTSGSRFLSRVPIDAREVSLQLEYMTDVDRVRLSKMEKALQGKPFIVCAYPDKSGWQFNDYTFVARFADRISYTQVFENVHSATLNIVEV